MSYLITQIVLCLLIAFLFGWFIGWLLKSLLMKSKLSDCEAEWKRKLSGAEDECITTRQELENCRSRVKILEAEYGSKQKDFEAKIRDLELKLQAKPVPAKAAAAKPAAKVVPTQKDDLKKIWGVGPYLEKILNQRGVYTFKQVANFTEEEMSRLSRVIGPFPDRIKDDNWKDQAKKLHKEKYGEDA